MKTSATDGFIRLLGRIEAERSDAQQLLRESEEGRVMAIRKNVEIAAELKKHRRFNKAAFDYLRAKKRRTSGIGRDYDTARKQVLDDLLELHSKAYSDSKSEPSE